MLQDLTEKCLPLLSFSLTNDFECKSVETEGNICFTGTPTLQLGHREVSSTASSFPLGQSSRKLSTDM